MTRAALLVGTLFLCGAPSAAAHPLEDGLVISDPEVTHALEATGFRFSDLIASRIDNSKECKSTPAGERIGKLFGRPPLCRVAEILKERVSKAQRFSLDSIAKSSATSDTHFPVDFFDDDNATLTLVGVVNRMDRTFRPTRDIGTSRADSCGEIRFIYRFGYQEAIAGENVASRLPLTLNLVMRARRPGQQEDCSSIARSWLDIPALLKTLGDAPSAESVAKILASKGPLRFLKPDQIDRIETNMQILRLPALTKEDFGTHAEYLLTVFNWDRDRKIFDPNVLENQIDPNLGLGDRSDREAFNRKMARLKAFLFRDDNLFDLDRGQVIIPAEFLARSAVSVAPGGSGRSQNGPLNALLGSKSDCLDQEKRRSVFCIDELDAVIGAYERRNSPLKQIKSASGFVMRVNDSSCTGCHQTRAVAGFHFTGADREDVFTANAVFVPGSPHLFGDLPRRAAILRQLASGTKIGAVNFSRGFSARPESRFASALASTTLFDGWGAACNMKNGTPAVEKSFSDWTCGAGLKCVPYMSSGSDPDRGICASKGTTEIGDPLETGKISTKRFGDDTYTRTDPNQVQAYGEKDTSLNLVNGETLAARLHLPKGPPTDSFVAAQQEAWQKEKTGGFPGGMLRTECCTRLPKNATCGQVAVDGFNACLDEQTTPFTACFRNNVNYAGLRACDAATPCREDYICLRPMLRQSSVSISYNSLRPIQKGYSCEKPDVSWLDNAKMGTCIPPYFVLQFRADKHHTTTVIEAGHR
jgi:hypothetical protein